MKDISIDRHLASTTVADAGGRYGVHPTWKTFAGDLHYVLFEPDPSEAARLQKKYAKRASEIVIEDCALAQEPGMMTINVFRHRALSSSAVRNQQRPFVGERRSEVQIETTLDVRAQSLDDYCDRNGLMLDFIKLDTEGTELDILRGAQGQLSTSVLGVRAEVNFERLFVGKELFSDMHDFMLNRGFLLLNLDYDGRGTYQSEFAKADGRYGILVATDAVWIRRTSFLYEGDGVAGVRESKVFKYAAFCFLNNAGDVAIDVLLEGRERYSLDYDLLQDSRLHRYVDCLVTQYFYALKLVPGQSLHKHQSAYAAIFDRAMKSMSQVMESDELNPE